MVEVPARQSRRRRRRWLTAAAVLVAAATLTSCQPCRGGYVRGFLDDGNPVLAHVFVGTVVDGTWTASLVEVEEVWVGPDLAAEVWLRSTLLPGAPLGDGERLVIGVEEGTRLRTGPCYVLEPQDPALEGLHPDTVRAPVAGGENGDPPLSTRIPDPRPYAGLTLLVFIGIAATIVVRTLRGRW